MKTLLRKKSFKIISISILLLLAGGVFLKSQGANFSWSQNSWLGGISPNVAKHSTDADNTWTNYSAKDNSLNIKGDGDAELKKADNWQETTDADFNAYTSKDSTLAVSGNSIKLLKANGATCSVAGDCQSNICTGNVCTACGTSTVSYGGKTYNTVSIGTQCWFKENLNVGTRVAGSATQTTSCSSIQKYCYSNTESICTTDGGLYQWNQAMCGSTTPGAQGICPSGWHIPTDAEQYTLENYLQNTTCSASRTGWDCSDAGTKLKSGGSSGFNAPLAGTRETDGNFLNRASNTHFWSSSAFDASYAWYRYLFSVYATVGRYDNSKALGFSVRCLKN